MTERSQDIPRATLLYGDWQFNLSLHFMNCSRDVFAGKYMGIFESD
jgi:hypothetical protein